jgi:agmatine/peptidylarginine deiminase
MSSMINFILINKYVIVPLRKHQNQEIGHDSIKIQITTKFHLVCIIIHMYIHVNVPLYRIQYIMNS